MSDTKRKSRAPEKYTCTRCGEEVERRLMMVKKVLFTTPGVAPQTHRSRVIDRLCPTCVAHDEHWNAPSLAHPNVVKRLANG